MLMIKVTVLWNGFMALNTAYRLTPLITTSIHLFKN